MIFAGGKLCPGAVSIRIKRGAAAACDNIIYTIHKTSLIIMVMTVEHNINAVLFKQVAKGIAHTQAGSMGG